MDEGGRIGYLIQTAAIFDAGLVMALLITAPVYLKLCVGLPLVIPLFSALARDHRDACMSRK
ncbi:MAG: hypothetical protein CMJ18_10860 [Phycisphaeraceae bacterium]|nr:hypothetical protein [Phycisphaeraceae bacterium]